MVIVSGPGLSCTHDSILIRLDSVILPWRIPNWGQIWVYMTNFEVSLGVYVSVRGSGGVSPCGLLVPCSWVFVRFGASVSCGVSLGSWLLESADMHFTVGVFLLAFLILVGGHLFPSFE